jgi:RimJ/RimL family protein N-acetyltransferase
VDPDIRIRRIVLSQRDLLVRMYDQFGPPGEALGLPPLTAMARRAWIRSALGHKVNVAAYSRDGQVVGHCFLVVDRPGSAELAVFVHPDFRRQGIGAALVMTTLDWGYAAGLRRVWSIAASDNRAALRLQQGCGFHLMKSNSQEAEMEIDLSVARAARGLAQPVCALGEPPIPSPAFLTQR